MRRLSMPEIKAEIRRTIDCQVSAHPAGKLLTALDANAVERLVNAIANNLTQNVDDMLADALGEQEAA